MSADGRQEQAGAPLLSVVMPSLNQASFIGAAVESVMSQTFQDLELIVMDGGSTDGTLLVLERLQSQFDGRLRWYSESDCGAADAINKALRLARGEFIGWLNSDDLYAPEAAQRAIEYFQRRPETILLYGAGQHIDEAGVKQERYPTQAPPLKSVDFRSCCPICQPTAFFRRELLAEVGMLDTSLHLSFDFDLWMRVFKRYPYQVGFVDAVQAYSRLHAACKTMRQRKEVALESMRVTARGLGNASPIWFYTWLEEFFREFPYGGQPVNARQVMHDAVQEGRSYLVGSDLAEFDARIECDARLRVMHDDASISIFPDGWASSECVLRVRARDEQWRTVRILGRHASPRGGALHISANTPDGRGREITVDGPGEFTFELDLPTDRQRPAYWSFVIKTDESFIPAEMEPTSTDSRTLAFLVRGLELG